MMKIKSGNKSYPLSFCDSLRDRALNSMRSMQAKSKSMGNDKMSLKEINKVIKKARNK